MIKIHTEKVIPVSGIVSRKIKTISGVLAADSLPYEYKYQSGPDTNWLEKTENALHVRGRPDDVELTEGVTYSEGYFQNGLAVIKKCGQRLHIINKKIAEKKKEWVGEETFVI
jgi:hypothetical protein